MPTNPKTGDKCRESLSTETTTEQTDFRNAEELRAEFDRIDTRLGTNTTTLKQIIEDEIIPAW